jgi:hypothetical protein
VAWMHARARLRALLHDQAQVRPGSVSPLRTIVGGSRRTSVARQRAGAGDGHAEPAAVKPVDAPAPGANSSLTRGNGERILLVTMN